MIISRQGFISVSGSTSEILADLGCIVDSLNTHLSELYGSEKAKQMINETVEMGFESEEENEAKLEKVKQELAEKLGKDVLNTILKGLV